MLRVAPLLRCVFYVTAYVNGLLYFAGCGPQAPEPAPVLPEFRTGAEVLNLNGFEALSGMTVGLVVNHTARIDSVHLGDAIRRASGVTLGAFFGPEHGIRGEAVAGEEVQDGIDTITGVPVYSLYGERRKPSRASLEGLDALVYDIQDIGVRFYTYISTMGYAMQAAAEAGIPFYVLDRPDPLGGDYVSGFVRREGFESFVGFYPVPIAYGLTPGELALMIKGEAFLDGLEDLDLRIVEMEGWTRSTQWPALSREWRAPSPNIPDFETALIYAGTCLFEAVSASEGRGTYEPFKQLGAPWIDSGALVDTLNGSGLSGVSFAPVEFTPQSIAGMSGNPRFKDEGLHGVYITVTDAALYDPLAIGIHLVHAFYQQAPPAQRNSFFNERWMGLLAGTDTLRIQLESGLRPDDIVASWQREVARFMQMRSPYLLYD